ncbi:MAG: MFS transporter [Promicromonosporaceae bacterium]|nr:MFS transporter [Promicromonosporaceae bacterium]
MSVSVQSAKPVSPVVLLLALLLVSLNMRTAITAVAPVLGEISAQLDLSAAAAGLLTSLPVLCFALFTPPSSFLIGRIGLNRAILVSLLGVIVGQAVRSSGGVVFLLAGTVIIGASITIGNVGIPVLIARDFYERSASVTGGYSALMNVGSTFATLLTAPLAILIGWRLALASWSILAVVAGIVWLAIFLPGYRNRRFIDDDVAPDRIEPDVVTGAIPQVNPPGSADADAPPKWSGRTATRITVLLCVCFIAQSGSYFAMTAWLPEVLQTLLGTTAVAAGNLASPFQFMAIAGALGVPFLLHRGLSARAVAVIMSVSWLTMPLGLLLAPELAWLWISLAGIAQGGNFTALFTLIVRRAASVEVARRITSAVLTVGYIGAAAAPTLLGWAASSTGGWTAPLLAVMGALLVMTGGLTLATSR